MAFVQLLGDSLLFKDIDAALLKPVTAYCRLVHSAAQAVVFREGSPAEELFSVIERCIDQHRYFMSEPKFGAQ